MIYIDTSVLLANLFVEGRSPQAPFWDQPLVSSRLIEYEVWNRIHARNLDRTHGEAARALLGRLAMLELAPTVLARALEPFPLPVRTLDAIHLATLHFLKERDPGIRLATYDARMAASARNMGFAVESP